MIRLHLSRRFEQLYAFVNGYFWLPCPVCGRPFGGHEHHGGVYYTLVPDDGLPREGQVTCSRCPGDHFAPSVPPERRWTTEDVVRAP